jgi:succinate-semialdehyde dehydrogenase/glutarate-semialdehyde dehydrogenase
MHPLDLHDSDLLRTQNFIGDQWVGACSGSLLAIEDPADGSVVASVPDSGKTDAQNALEAASAAFRSWRQVAPRERASVLKRWHSLVVSHIDDLSKLISREQGKPLAEARGEMLYAASYIEWFSEEAARITGDVIAAPDRRRRMFAVKEPVGVVAVITPWNFPAAMIARKIAPALAAGCTVVAKPSEDTPLTSLALARLAQEAGVPPGVLNVVCASRERTPAVVDVWLSDPRVRKVSFTGSTAVGKHLARASSGTLKKLSLELGGNAPFIVFEDADLEAALDGLMLAKFRNGGQTCISPNRVYVQASVYEEFAQRLAKRVGGLKVGPASDPGAQIGPMINARAVEKIHRHIADAVAKGCRVLVGGADRLHGNYVRPTVLADASPSMELSCEETFGPVAALSCFQTEDEVIHLANDTPFGLAAYVYSTNLSRIWRVSDALETGIIGINEGAVSCEAAPFGGVKESGYGREGSVHGLDEYMHLKYLCQGSLH